MGLKMRLSLNFGLFTESRFSYSYLLIDTRGKKKYVFLRLLIYTLKIFIKNSLYVSCHQGVG